MERLIEYLSIDESTIALGMISDLIEYDIHRPLEEGTPGCEGFPLACVLVPLFERDHLAALICRVFVLCILVFSYAFIPASLMLHFTC